MTPKDEPEVMRAKARKLLEAFELGDEIERTGARFYCEIMMVMCHRQVGQCACLDYDRKQNPPASDDRG